MMRFFTFNERPDPSRSVTQTRLRSSGLRCSPGSDRSSAPFLRCDVAHRLREFPAVAAHVLEDSRAFAVLVGSQFLNDARTTRSRTRERLIDLWHPHFDHLRDGASARHDLIAPDVADNDGAVRSDSQ